MELYLVFDKKNRTCTAPAICETLQEAHEALTHINPENISDLIIQPLLTINTIEDLFLLEINPNKSLPEFLYTRSVLAPEGNETTQQVEDALVLDGDQNEL